MDIFSLFITPFMLGVSLAMDAFAASVTSGACDRNPNVKKALKTAAFYGIFQGIMPTAGYFLGVGLLYYIEAFDHWVAFILLAALGFKMICDCLKKEDENCEVNTDYANTKTLIVMAFATSIDALAAGISLAIESTNIALAASIIAVVTFGLCVGGYYIGKKLGQKFKRGALALGGIILIALGIKILITHMI